MLDNACPIWGGIPDYLSLKLQRSTGPLFKVQLSPEFFFRLYKSSCLFDHRCEKLPLQLFSLIFYDFSKFLNLAVSVPHGRAIEKNGVSWPVM